MIRASVVDRAGNNPVALARRAPTVDHAHAKERVVEFWAAGATGLHDGPFVDFLPSLSKKYSTAT